MNTIQVQMASLRRKGFTGRTDKYAVSRPNTPSVPDMIQRDLGFIDVTNGQFSDFYRETAVDRLAAYKKALDFYEGRQWDMPIENGEEKPQNNFCATVVNKATDFMYGTGLNFASAPGNELLADLIGSIWDANGKNVLYQNMCLNGSVLGDCFVYITLTKEQKIKLLLINPQFCFPIFDRDSTTIKAVMVQYPGEGSQVNGAPVMETIYITETEVVQYKDTEEVADSRVPNIFGFVPMVHIPNLAIPGKLFGRSDIKDVIPLNKEYNTMMHRMRRIINYHAEPTTIIFGAKASRLEKGANKVWSGLPADGRVENLQLTTDLGAVTTYMDKIELSICRVADLPSCVFNTDVAISNTSGVALRLLYKPILDRVTRKRVPMGEGILRINKMIVDILSLTRKEDILSLVDNKDNLAVNALFSDSLPRDESELLDAEIKKLSSNLTSVAESFRTINAGKDMTRIASEIVMDLRGNLAMEKEKAVALQGGTPNLVAPFLGSIPANEDLETLAQASAKEHTEVVKMEQQVTTGDQTDAQQT